MIHVLNGTEATAIVKASAISKASELNHLFIAGRDHVLKVLFSGGVIRDKKLQRGSVYTFAEVSERNTGVSSGSEDFVASLFESISLLKWLVPCPLQMSQTTPRLRVF